MKTNANDKSEPTVKHHDRAAAIKRARVLASLAIVAILIASFFIHTGTGTPSAFGIGGIAAVCPLGQLEVALGSKAISVHGLALLAFAVVITFVVGKAFCSWICPIPWIQKIVRPKQHNANGKLGDESQTKAPSLRNKRLDPIGGERDGQKIDTRHAVLLGSLASCAVFGFPVFCLVCPIGLTFATIIGIGQLLLHNETSWGLLLFPTIILLETVFFRKWCRRICPVGALISLLSAANRTLKPKVKSELCLRESGVDCRSCVSACPEKLDPHSDKIPECTKCGDCVSSCPAHAISFKLLDKRN